VRKNIVAGILLGLIAILVAGIVLRAKTAHVAPVASQEPVASASALPSASVARPIPATSGTPTAEPKKLGRPLKVSALGWELSAPLLLENGGLSTKSFAISVVDEMKDVENALARGGVDKAGADVAIVPLPNLVMSYDRLRALSPVVVFVSGWSRGREVLAGKEPLERMPAQGDVLVRSAGGDSALAFALFGLELAGVAPERVKLGEPADKPKLAALVRDELKPGDQTDILVSTGDASRFVPFVVIAPASFVEKESPTLTLLEKTWLAGVKHLESDPTAGARTIAGLPGAPEPLALLGRLGNVATISLSENAELLGLSGRGAVTIEALFARMFRLLKEAKLLTSQAPERSPIAPAIVAGLVRSEPSLAKPKSPENATTPKPKAQKALLVVRVEGDEDEVAKEIAFVLGAFPRTRAKLTLHRGLAMKALVETLTGRYGLEADRIQPGKSEARGRTAATLEISPVP
jgi:hypothetical protein